MGVDSAPLESRLHRLIFASGDNPMSTIEFVENRGLDLFEDISDNRKKFNPRTIPTREIDDQGSYVQTHGMPDFPLLLRDEIEMTDYERKYRFGYNTFSKLPVLIGGRNGSGKTSLLNCIKLVCDLLQKEAITPKDASEIWHKLKSMNVDRIILVFSAIIPELSNVEKLEFFESITQIEMNSTDPDKTLKWCDGIQVRNPNFNISESQMYHKIGKFNLPRKAAILPKYKSIIGKSRIQKFLDKQSKETEGVDENYPHLGSSYLHECIKNFISRMEITEYNQHEIKFQEAVLINVDRKSVENELEWMKKRVPEITNRYQKLTKSSKLIHEELTKIDPQELFSLIYGQAKNVIQQNEKGVWDLLDWAPEMIERLQYPHTNGDDTPDWFRWPGNWREKDDAMEFVVEGALLDIISWLTGKPQLDRSFLLGKQGLEWVEADANKSSGYFGGVRKYEEQKGEREIPSIHTALKNPVFARLVGLEEDETSGKQIDILLRMNYFTPIQEITTSYLTSGQRQVLALIIAVRNSKEGSLILVDEPELSLHVDWQSALVQQLHAPLTGSQLVICTHSPDITMNHLHLCNILTTKQEDSL